MVRRGFLWVCVYFSMCREGFRVREKEMGVSLRGVFFVFSVVLCCQHPWILICFAERVLDEDFIKKREGKGC